MSLQKLKGENFRAFVNNAAVAEEQSVNVTISGNMEDATSKDTVGGYSQEDMVSRQYQIQVESNAADLTTLRALITMFNSDTPIPVGFDATTPGTNQNRTPANADFARSGTAFLNDLTIQADDRANVQVSCQYTGDGALA